MAPLSKIIANLDSLLEKDAFDDYCPNGLQVAGATEVQRVLTGVSAHIELFERAISEQAQLVLVHHGLFWRGDDPCVVGRLKRRLKLLLDNEISLAAYHLPLDGHPKLGNNALIAAGLGALEHTPFAHHHGRPIGIGASFPGDGITIEDLLTRVSTITGRDPLVFIDGPQTVRRVAIVSGGGSSYLDEAAAAGFDAFITGEPTERAMAVARESGIHYIAAGHYATETFGVRALGERLSEHFGLTHVFADFYNPI